MRKIPLFPSCIIAAMSLLFGPPLVVRCPAATKEVIKFAALAPEGSAWIKEMRRLEKDLKAESGGRLILRIYAGGIAGDEIDVLKKIKIGQIHCAAFSGVGLGKILPMVRVLDLPFLFRNETEIDRVHESLREYFKPAFRKKGFEFLAWAEVGNVHIFSKVPIRKVTDLSRLKVWTWTGDPLSKATFTRMGVNPIPLAVTDVTTALNTGMIDTVYAPPLGALALQWHRSEKTMMEMPLVHSTGAVLMSRKRFRRLPHDLATLVKEEFSRAMTRLTTGLRKQSREAVQMIRQSGLTVTPAPTGEDLQAFYRIHDQVARDLTGRLYPRELLDRVYRLLGRK